MRAYQRRCLRIDQALQKKRIRCARLISLLLCVQRMRGKKGGKRKGAAWGFDPLVHETHSHDRGSVADDLHGLISWLCARSGWGDEGGKRKGGSWGLIKQYTRVTVTIDDVSHMSCLGDAMLRSYDILAVRPLSERVFEA